MKASIKIVVLLLVIIACCTPNFVLGQQATTPPTKELVQDNNLKVINHVIAQLEDKAHWAKNSTFGEACDATATTHTLGCALKNAQIELTGVYEHRNLLMRVVRKHVRKNFFFRQGFHPIDGFNKHNKTSHEEVLFVINATKKELALKELQKN